MWLLSWLQNIISTFAQSLHVVSSIIKGMFLTLGCLRIIPLHFNQLLTCLFKFFYYNLDTYCNKNDPCVFTDKKRYELTNNNCFVTCHIFEVGCHNLYNIISILMVFNYYVLKNNQFFKLCCRHLFKMYYY